MVDDFLRLNNVRSTVLRIEKNTLTSIFYRDFYVLVTLDLSTVLGIENTIHVWRFLNMCACNIYGVLMSVCLQYRSELALSGGILLACKTAGLSVSWEGSKCTRRDCRVSLSEERG